MATTLAERERALEARAKGDVYGHGTWLIEPATGGAVDVTYRWDVALRRSWMRRLACRFASLHESSGSAWP